MNICKAFYVRLFLSFSSVAYLLS